MFHVRAKLLHRRASLHEAGHCVAALTLAFGVERVSIADAAPHMLRGRYSPPPNIRVEALCTVCMAGPSAEEYFVGKISDGSDAPDIASVAII